MSNDVRNRIAGEGFSLAGERHKAVPTAYCIVGGRGPNDRSAEAMAKLYPDDSAKHRRARAIILGARDRLRVTADPPRAFIDSCTNGIVEDIGVADLGPDKNGKTWLVVLVGRQRVQARRILDIEGASKKPPTPVLEIVCVIRPFPINRAGDFDHELTALEANCKSNVRVPMTISQMADHAANLTAKGMQPADVAVRIGANGAAHVEQLLSLSKCEPCVQDAVDAGKVPIGDCAHLSTLNASEQERRMARKTAGASKASKDAAAPPRPRARNAYLAAALASEADALDGVSPESKAIFAFFGGKDDAFAEYPRLSKMVESAQEIAKKKGAA